MVETAPVDPSTSTHCTGEVEPDRFASEREIGESSGLSLQPESATEFDLGFLGESAHKVVSDEDSDDKETLAKKAESESGSSPEYFLTPSVSLAKGSSGSRLGAVHKGKTPKAKRPINLQSINVEPLSLPSELPSGEVDSEPDTPTTICPAFEVFGPDERNYLVKSPIGQLPVLRLNSADLAENGGSMADEAEKQREELRRSISPTGGRDFTGKLRAVGGRARVSSENRYPEARVNKANTVRQSRAKSAENESEDAKQNNFHNKRGPDGRFRKKSPQ